jgi:hypothetical protein
MKAWLAISLTLVLLASALFLERHGVQNAHWIVIVATAGWAAGDSTSIKLSEFKSPIPYKPLTLFAAIALFWIVGFPMYLIVRYQIKNGRRAVRDKPLQHIGFLSRGI